MRVAVVSDIHANKAAFKAVIQTAREETDEIWCLGDLVGYGPDPGDCIELAQKHCSVILAGNHDLAACGKLDVSDFSSHARRAMEWTWDQILPEQKNFLRNLPVKLEYQGVLLSHGSPANPVWEYILSESDALAAFVDPSFTCCFFGHTHLPSGFILCRKALSRNMTTLYGDPDAVITLKSHSCRYLLNPGSVGFPRDSRDAHASDSLDRAAARFAIYDTEQQRWEFKRIEYNMRDTAERMVHYRLW
ncbi:MAG: metallophosphoesterase family protein [Termitinemataceae bacterium]